MAGKRYESISAGKGPNEQNEDAVLRQFPGLTKQDLTAANDLFSAYVFYKTKGAGRVIWTSCCGKKEQYIGEDMRTVGPKDRAALWARHGDRIECPFCGRSSEVKCVGKIGAGKLISEYRPAVFLHTSRDGKTIYAQGYWMRKEYSKEDTDTLCVPPKFMATIVYRFRAGEAIRWEQEWDGKWIRTKESCFGEEPFRQNGLFSGVPEYSAIGMERLEKSFLRYIDLREAQDAIGYVRGIDTWTTLMRLLYVAAQYPRQTEMLLKMGLTDILSDWVHRKKKNAAVLHWEETDPRRAFRLTGAELKEWIDSGGETRALTFRKFLAKQGICAKISEAAAMLRGTCDLEAQLRKAFRRAEEYHGKKGQVLRYLRDKSENELRGRLEAATRYWLDYIDAAESNGDELWKKKNFLPQDLRQAHDSATGIRQARIAAAEKKAAKEKGLADAKIWAAREEEVRRKYALEMDGLVIAAPRCEADILQEGKALCHCVGGYADRHRDGKTTILFLRKATEPDKPFLTIEMNGNKLVQIHGYRNEGVYTGKGRFAPDPRKVYKDWLDTWMRWLLAGSPRKKDGTARILKKKKAAA